MIGAEIISALPALLGGAGSGGVIVAWWRHRERARKQTDDVALDLVNKLQTRVNELEALVAYLQHELRNASTEADGIFWMLKYVPESRREEAVKDIEARRRERADRKGNERQRAQIALSAERVIGEPGGS